MENEPRIPLWRSQFKKALPPAAQGIIVRIKTFFLLKAPFLPTRAVRITFKPKTILFYPHMPNIENSVIAKICYLNRYRITGNTGQKFHLAISWHPYTYPSKDETLTKLTGQHKVINAECRDLSKKYIDSVFKGVFGYGITLDPLSRSGECVVKSDENARHDGKVVKCPLKEIKEGAVYQKVINNQKSGDLVQDIRIPVFGERIPFVYLKYRPVSNRFSNDNTKVSLTKPQAVLSKEEIRKVILFCKKMNLEYGELDAARDVDSDGLYIFDTNNTPWGPPNHISAKDYRKALRLLAKTFDMVFLENLR